MSLTLLLGGARSGKSRLAVELAEARRSTVVYLATGEPRDEEMRARIELHRAERPGAWETVEEPLELERAIRGAAADACLVVDCLSLWVSNALEQHPAEQVEALGAAAAEAAASRAGLTIAVSNEVGLGIVPPHTGVVDGVQERGFRIDFLSWTTASSRVSRTVAVRHQIGRQRFLGRSSGVSLG